MDNSYTGNQFTFPGQIDQAKTEYLERFSSSPVASINYWFMFPENNHPGYGQHQLVFDHHNGEHQHMNLYNCTNGSPTHFAQNPHIALRGGVIISSNNIAPDGYICIGRVVESPSRNPFYRTPQNRMMQVNDRTCEADYNKNFNPRLIASMTAKEKVSKWIQNIPFHLDDEVGLTMDCFPAVASYSSSSTYSDGDIDYSEVEAILELQARRVTRYTTKMYTNDGQPTARSEEFDENYDNGSQLISSNEALFPVEHPLVPYRRKSDINYLIKATF